MVQEVRVCHYKKLKIRFNGDIYPCCVAPAYTKIGSVFDDDIIEKIKNTDILCECKMYKSVKANKNDKPELNYIHYETSNVCQADCVCCPQNKDPMKNEEELLNRISYLIDYFKPKNIVAIGGEILVQEKAFKMLYNFHKKYPAMKIHTISNLAVKEKRLKEAEEIFDEITVSMLGFNKLTYKNEMNLDFDMVKNNFEYLYNNKQVSLRPKFLAMPTNLFDIIPFFEWAIKMDVDKIYLHNIHEFRQVANLNERFWQRTFDKVEKQVKKILIDNKNNVLNKNGHFISIHPVLAEMLHIDTDYLTQNDFNKHIFITN